MFQEISTTKNDTEHHLDAKCARYSTTEFARMASIDDVFLLTIRSGVPGNQSVLATIGAYDGASRRPGELDKTLHFTYAAWTGGSYVREDIAYEIPYPHTIQGRRIATVGKTPPSRGGAD